MEGFIHQTVGSKETEGECDLNYCIGAPGTAGDPLRHDQLSGIRRTQRHPAAEKWEG